MGQISISLKKLVLAALLLNIPLLVAYVFLNVHIEKTEVILDIQRKRITSSTRYEKTGISTANATIRVGDNRTGLLKLFTNVTYAPTRTAVFENLIDKWQPIDTTANSQYVFSAFLYKVGSAPTIRIIGAMCQSSIKSKIYCKLRYRSSPGNESVVTVIGSGKQLPEGSGFKYGAGFFHCRLPDKRVPVTVAVTTHPNVTAVNQLPVRSQEVNPSDRKQFAVCVSPLFGGYNSTTDIIQWIELNRILGADLFVFYNFSTGKNVGKLLEFYSGKNLVKVIPWDVSKFRPPGKKHELNYAGQTVALNDCLMRVKPISEFVVNIDLDELIVPHGGLTTWWDIVNKNPDVAVYNFRSSFFRLNWDNFRLNWDNFDKDFPRKDVAEKHKLSFLLKLDREVKIFPPNDRTKYFAKTDVADSLGVHKVFALTSPHKSEMFPPEVALVHHYRTIYATINGVSQPDYMNKGPKVFDDSVLKLYGDRLIDNVLKIRNELNQ